MTVHLELLKVLFEDELDENANDGEIAGHHRRHCRQCAHIHQQFAVAGDHRDLRFRS